MRLPRGGVSHLRKICSVIGRVVRVGFTQREHDTANCTGACVSCQMSKTSVQYDTCQMYYTALSNSRGMDRPLNAEQLHRKACKLQSRMHTFKSFSEQKLKTERHLAKCKALNNGR